MFEDVDHWQFIFFISAAAFVAYQMFRGWRLGVVRQLVNLVALIAAYAVAIFGGRMAVPVFNFLHYPDFIVSFVAGSILAVIGFVAIATVGRILFRRTNQQSIGLLRMGYGAGGSFIGMVFGFLTVWLVVLAIKLLGSIADTELMAREPAPRRMQPQSTAFAEGVAHMKHSLERGSAGALVQRMDPIPTKAYSIASKIGRVVSNRESVERFLAFPGAKHLSQHPRIVALQNDPAVTREIQEKNYFGLLKNHHIVQAVNDPEVGELIRKFELERALDYALAK
jgi:hypothetical protein